ncbi:MAG: hypothetical protein E5X73_34180 [Mesorhizobium sp.]|nr:MAG: hypothetical protein E5Y77_27555 [Mesorhizobium sp.]TIP08026.1 MAG: hypothetical protein E5X73_34180 [Mesorhizobium sp.]
MRASIGSKRWLSAGFPAYHQIEDHAALPVIRFSLSPYSVSRLPLTNDVGMRFEQASLIGVVRSSGALALPPGRSLCYGAVSGALRSRPAWRIVGSGGGRILESLV